MKKFYALALPVIAMTATNATAQDFTVLATPEEVYENSIEDVDGAKTAFRAVLDNESATEAQKVAAMKTYQQNATPAPGYAFDMTYLLKYTAVTEENKNGYTPANLATAWSTDIEGLTFGEGSTDLATGSNTTDGVYMRVNSKTVLKEEASFDKFAAYQTVSVSKGSYVLESQAYVAGAAKTANLAAGDLAVSADFIGGGKMSSYSLSFRLTDAQDIKLGFKRNSTAGGLTTIYFNNINFYKTSSVIVINDAATGPLAAAEGADVQLNREFTAGQYTPICLPFKIENWREVFDDLLLWTNYTTGEKNELVFSTVGGKDTQARKPYLAKPKKNITPANYLVFNNVTIQAGNAGSWERTAEEEFPVKMVGNWAAGFVPENCYYLEKGEWILSDGTAALPAFSAYIDATALTERPETLKMTGGNGTATNIPNTIISSEPSTVCVYSIQGILLKRDVNPENALEALPAGLYIVNGKKVIKR